MKKITSMILTLLMCVGCGSKVKACLADLENGGSVKYEIQRGKDDSISSLKITNIVISLTEEDVAEVMDEFQNVIDTTPEYAGVMFSLVKSDKKVTFIQTFDVNNMSEEAISAFELDITVSDMMSALEQEGCSCK